MKKSQRVLSLLLCLVVMLSMISAPSVAYAGLDDAIDYGFDTLGKWLSGSGSQPFGGWNIVDYGKALFASDTPQKYYTTPTSSVVDRSGNVTNYYRGGDTTNTKIIDSYNKTFNTIHNTTNNTNNYEANVKLSNFLNQYTTNNNNYTYSTNFKSWYYDNTTNNYNYSQNNLYYNEDNSRYYLTIDNSTDEYYMVDIQYSPTFVTVNYTYNNTVNNNQHYGDVTNVYYYELKDGRNSSTLTAAEVAGMDFGYDVKNYELVTDDPNTLSLQHFDGDYTDSSSYNRTFYSQNRSTQYVDSGAFGQAVKLSSGSAAGVTIPNLSNNSSLSFDFRVYYADISNLGIYFGDTNLLQAIPSYRSWSGQDTYSDHDVTTITRTSSDSNAYGHYTNRYTFEELGSTPSLSSSLSSRMSVPTSYFSAGYSEYSYSPKRYGWFSTSGTPSLYSSTSYANWFTNGVMDREYIVSSNTYRFTFHLQHYIAKQYRWTPPQSVHADFSYSNYKNQWVSMRITIANGKLYYFVNGDLVGSGTFTKPTADKFYIKSSGTVYLDELRVTTGSLSSTTAYTPSSSPYDTNKVLALPDNLVANTIYVKHLTPIKNHRIGGVRPSNPETGFFYVPLYDDYTGGQPQLYDGSNWVNVDAVVYDGKTIKDVKGFKFSPVGSSPDVDIDAKPERPEKPGDNVDPETCKHEWKETDRTPATCSAPGSVESTCSKCQKTKTESLPKLGHTWEVKQSVQTSYDENGNIVTQGFTIYRCSVCGEEYKDIDGSGPPSGSTTTPGDGGEEEEGFLSWLLRKIGELLGAIGGGIIELLKATLGKILDSLISLVTMALDKLTQLVDLFGSFGDALGVLWTWLPPEIMLVLVAGVTVFVFIGLLKLFMK